jgi:hypothetical protein
MPSIICLPLALPSGGISRMLLAIVSGPVEEVSHRE